jgi:tRNA U34 5-carboxymethylaminomethyl modifying enzyme MnmG/GidA
VEEQAAVNEEMETNEGNVGTGLASVRLVPAIAAPTGAINRAPTVLPRLEEGVAEEVELQVKYESYVRKQEQTVHRTKRLEEYRIPETIDYHAISHLRTQARQKLTLTRPRTIGQASRVEGVTPADIAILMVYVEKMRGGDEGKNGSGSVSEAKEIKTRLQA